MIDRLIPWKKRSDELKIRHEDNPISRLRDDFETLWNRMLHDGNGGLSEWNGPNWFGSRMELDDLDKEYVLQADVPGFEPDEIDVKVSGNVLTVSAQHSEEGDEENGHFHRHGSYYQTHTLPQGVISDQIEARYHSGVLEVHLPKSEECEAKRIEVKSA